MKNAGSWAPTKYVVLNGRLRGSRNAGALAVGSRLTADLVAGRYEKYLPLHARGKLLDLGCGMVPLYETYRSHVTAVLTLDWSGSIHASPYVDLSHDLNQPLPLPDASVDSVIMADTLEHIARPRELCDEIGRVLAAGGRLVGNVPFIYPIHEQPHDYFRYTEFGLRSLIEGAGMRLLALEPTGGSLESFADMVAKHLAATSAAGRLIAIWIQGLAFWFAGTSLGRKLTERTAASFPLGYFFVAEKLTVNSQAGRQPSELFASPEGDP